MPESDLDGLDGEHLVHPSWPQVTPPPLEIKHRSPLADVQIRGAVKRRCRQLSLLVSEGWRGWRKEGYGCGYERVFA